MIARPHAPERVGAAPDRRPAQAIEALVSAGAAAAAARTRREALEAIAAATLQAAQAEAAVIRVVDPVSRTLNAAAVASDSPAAAAELEGTRFALDDVASEEIDDIRRLPAGFARAAKRLRLTAVLQLAVFVGDEIVGTLEVMRSRPPFSDVERRTTRLAAAQAGLAIRGFERPSPPIAAVDSPSALVLAGDALAAGSDRDRTPQQVTRLAAAAVGAAAALLWRRGDDGRLDDAAVTGISGDEPKLDDIRAAAERALNTGAPVTTESSTGHVSVALQLGQPPVGVLQLLYPAGFEAGEDQLAGLATFGVRAAQALRAGSRAQSLSAELDRTRALLGVVGQAISELSLTHTLETAIARVAELLGVERLVVYLRDEDRLYAAAGIGLAGPHVRLAERLFELALGPFRGRGLLEISDVRADPRLAAVGDAAAEAGIEGAIALPLRVRNEAIGLLAVFPQRGRSLTENEASLLGALAAQLSVAVQNAQLHEQAKLLGEERRRALEAEQDAARQLGALYEISRSFAQSLSLEATLEAVTQTTADVLELDVTVIFMPDERRELLLPHTLRVHDTRYEDAVRTLVLHPLPFGVQAFQRLFRLGEPFDVTPNTARRIGTPLTALVPFLERGWTASVIPIATPAEVVACILLVSMHPANPITADKIERAQVIAGQAALAIDNARLYQQQKEFADTMQRSLLPSSMPRLPGLEIGSAYESSARVEVGGDVYDFLELEDGRLAVVLGDVTGHGIDAAADMAMAKFVFRSLAREHPEPVDFLRSANDVIVGEIAPGKFITMVYLLVDAARGEVAAAGAGHPPPRLLGVDGVVRGLEVRGIVLGVESALEFTEVRTELEPRSAVILYTDGVLEARRHGELYGFERLDAVIAAGRNSTAQELAEAILADCREFAADELADDCAVVVIRRA